MISSSGKKARQLRKAAIADGDGDDGADPGASGVQQSREKKEKKAVKKSLLSFGSDDEDEDGGGGPKIELKKKKKKERRNRPFGSATGVEHLAGSSSSKMGASLDRPTPNTQQSAAGEYTAERMAMLQKNARHVKTSASKSAGEETGFVIKGGFKPAEKPPEEEKIIPAPVDDDEIIAPALGVIPDKATIARARAKREAMRNAQSSMEQTLHGLDEDTVREGEQDSDSGEDDMNTRRLDFGRPEEDRLKLQATGMELDGDMGHEESFEEEQMRKAVGHSMTIGVGGSSSIGQAQRDHEVGLSASIDGRSKIMHNFSVQAVACMQAVQRHMSALDDKRKATRAEYQKVSGRVEDCRAHLSNHGKNFDGIRSKYDLVVNVKEYLTDLCECLEAKMPFIIELENELDKIIFARAETLRERRKLDWEEQAVGAAAALPATMAAFAQKRPIDEARAEIAAAMESAVIGDEVEVDEFGRDLNYEQKIAVKRRRRKREERRAALRKKINDTAGGIRPLDGEVSSDESDTEVDAFIREKAKVLETGRTLFLDVADEFASVESVKNHLEDWKRGNGKHYKEVGAANALVGLFSPFVRCEMLEWTPLEDAQAGKPLVPIDQSEWFNALFDFGTEDSSSSQFNQNYSGASSEAESNIIPAIVERLFIPRMRSFVEKIWEKSSLRHARVVREAIHDIAAYIPPSTNSTFAAIFQQVKDGVKGLIDQVEEVPLWPRNVMEYMPEDAREFRDRTVGIGLRTVRIALVLDFALDKETMAKAVGTVIKKCILPLMRTTHANDGVQYAKTLIGLVPQSGDFLQVPSCYETLKSLAEAIQSVGENDLLMRIHKLL